MTMSRLTLTALCSVSLLLACKGGGAELVKAQEKFADDACACKDMDCIKKVQEAQQKWVTDHGQAAVGDEADAEKIAAANQKLTECVTKIAQAAAGQ